MLERLRDRLVPLEDALDRYGTAWAAVSVLLREREGLEVLLTRRAERGDDPWSGQWSFPGGGRQAGEPLLETARRETAEEVHLHPDREHLLGCLPARPPANRPELLVLPFVFRWDGEEVPRPGPEVAEAAWFPLAGLAATRTTATVRVRGHELTMPAFLHERRTVWGFTYRALEDLFRRLD